jgi:phospholipid/cholesterol/gamma-HCH transport system substrate-binding protein
MEKTQTNFKFWLGLFVTAGLFLFVGAIFVIGKQKNMFNPVFLLRAHFYNVSGLQVGNKVRFSGINVGTVDKITILNDSTVSVEMLVRKEVQEFIKVDCEAAIGSEGIIGDKVLNISQSAGAGKVVKSGQQLRAREPVEMDAMMVSVRKTVDNLQSITFDFAAITREVNNGEIVANIETMTQDFSEIAHNVNHGKGTLARLIKDPSIATNLGKTMENLKKSSKGLNENMNAAKDNFLLRGYYKRKERKALEKKQAAEDKLLEEEKAKQKAIKRRK